MTQKIVFALLLLLSSIVSSKTLPLENFVSHGDYLNMTLSPDGKHLLARVRADGKVFLVVLDAKTMKIVGGVTPQKNDIIHSATWINNERYVFEFAEKQNHLDVPIATGELFATNIDGSKRLNLYGYRASDSKQGSSRIAKKKNSKATQEIVSFLDGDDDNILIIEHPWSTEGNFYYDDRKKKPRLSRLNIYTGYTKKLETLPYPGARVLATNKGEVNFISWRDQQNKFNAAYRKDNDSPWQELGEALNLQKNLSPILLSNDSSKVFMLGHAGEKILRTIYEFDLATGQHTEVFTGLSTDVEEWITDTETGAPVVGISYPNKSAYHYSKSSSKTITSHKMLADAFSGSTVYIASTDKSGDLLLVHVSSDVNPGEYYMFNLKTNDAQFLWANRSWIDPNDMIPKTPIKLVTSDNVELNGYLTLPANLATEQKPPLVVLPHGGPHQRKTRDFWHFDSEVQLLANRGFAVLQVNFRGSNGYGEKFEQLGYKQWGGKMIDDIIEATQWTVSQQLVDPDRICIYGASYGGYAALMASVKAPELYKCTVGYVGIYDLSFMYSESDIPRNLGGLAYLKEVLGTSKKQLDDYSPVNHVEKIQANIMLIHGAKDRRVPEVNAEKLMARLQSIGKKATYLRYKQSGHGVWDLESRKDLYQGLVDFLQQNTAL
jgi:dipeptidyl aminopeptidase/acylaminoacyl peptidase